MPAGAISSGRLHVGTSPRLVNAIIVPVVGGGIKAIKAIVPVMLMTVMMIVIIYGSDASSAGVVGGPWCKRRDGTSSRNPVNCQEY